MTHSKLQFAAAACVSTDIGRAIDEVIERIDEQLPSKDLVVVFFSAPFIEAIEGNPGIFVQRFGTPNVIGCSAESIIGGDRELENEPAMTAWAASLPGCNVRPMHLRYLRAPDGGAFTGWPPELAAEWPREATLICLGEPLTFPGDLLLANLNEDRAGMPVVGGMASCALGSNRLIVGDQLVEDGAVAVLISGDVRTVTIVSQGCRPIGEPAVVTRSEANEILQIRGEPALEFLQKLYATLPTREQRLVREGLHIGRVISEYQDRRQFGDFLVRNVLSADPERQAICIGDFIRPGQTIQFHIRDHASADADLREWLQRARESIPAGAPLGGLLFTCNGRGTNLFPQADHDAAMIQSMLGPLPLSGFFAAGELGPVGGQNFVHGYTASLALFTTRR
jgi:small ligand-binding sensory domain FIST